MPGTLTGLPVLNRRKVGMTSSPHGLYAQGLARRYNGHYRAKRDREVEQIAKKGPQFRLQADNSPEKIGIAGNRVSADVSECVRQPLYTPPVKSRKLGVPEVGLSTF